MSVLKVERLIMELSFTGYLTGILNSLTIQVWPQPTATEHQLNDDYAVRTQAWFCRDELMTTLMNSETSIMHN